MKKQHYIITGIALALVGAAVAVYFLFPRRKVRPANTATSAPVAPGAGGGGGGSTLGPANPAATSVLVAGSSAGGTQLAPGVLPASTVRNSLMASLNTARSNQRVLADGTIVEVPGEDGAFDTSF
jgi:hypothetical protein